MLEVVGRGLENVVCVLKSPLETGVLANEKRELKRDRDELDAMPKEFRRTTKGVTDWGFCCGTVKDTWEAIQDHRFIAGIFHNSQPDHWAVFVFDREAKVLVIWDSYKDGAEDRFLADCAYWREYLMTIGQPFTFQAVAVPVAWRSDGHSCGLISIWQLFVSLRGWVGARVSEFEPCQYLQLDSLPTDPVDWHKQTPIRFTNTPGIKEAKRLLLNIAINELGSNSFKVNIRPGVTDLSRIVDSSQLCAESVCKKTLELEKAADGFQVDADVAFSQFGG
jgi:hypothetical protein